jgi:ribosomal protein L7/L12
MEMMRCPDCQAEVPGSPERCPFCAALLRRGVRLVDPGRNLIEVIKAIRTATGIGLKEAKDFVDSAPSWIPGDPATLERLLTDAGARVDGGSGGGESAEAEVVLLRSGPNLIAVIKEVREATGLGLKEAKDLTEGAPRSLGPMNADRAERVVAALREAGADAEIRGGSAPPPPAVADDSVEVVLQKAGPNLIAAIKLVREVTGLGLFEAKQLVEHPPQSLGRMKPSDAERLRGRWGFFSGLGVSPPPPR